MKAKLKIIRYRKRWPLKSSYEISKMVGVSRQYVSKILKQAELPTSAPREKKIIFFCKQCDVGLSYQGKRGQSKNYCSDTCKYNYRWIKVKCTGRHVCPPWHRHSDCGGVVLSALPCAAVFP